MIGARGRSRRARPRRGGPRFSRRPLADPRDRGAIDVPLPEKSPYSRPRPTVQVRWSSRVCRVKLRARGRPARAGTSGRSPGAADVEGDLGDLRARPSSPGAARAARHLGEVVVLAALPLARRGLHRRAHGEQPRAVVAEAVQHEVAVLQMRASRTQSGRSRDALGLAEWFEAKPSVKVRGRRAPSSRIPDDGVGGQAQPSTFTVQLTVAHPEHVPVVHERDLGALRGTMTHTVRSYGRRRAPRARSAGSRRPPRPRRSASQVSTHPPSGCGTSSWS